MGFGLILIVLLFTLFFVRAFVVDEEATATATATVVAAVVFVSVLNLFSVLDHLGHPKCSNRTKRDGMCAYERRRGC